MAFEGSRRGGGLGSGDPFRAVQAGRPVAALSGVGRRAPAQFG